MSQLPSHLLADDPYFKKVVSFAHGDVVLDLAVSQQLFSSHDVDHGSRRLLRTILFEDLFSAEAVAADRAPTRLLDLGCGYGPIGLTLKALVVNSGEATANDIELQLVDPDALALHFAAQNAEHNQLQDQTTCTASLGYSGLDSEERFDLITSNIPAKVGSQMLRHLVLGAAEYLTDTGRAVIVVVDDIDEEIQQLLERDEIEVLYERSWPGHHVYHYSFTEPVSTPVADIVAVSRGARVFSYRGKDFELETSYMLPEFDELGYDTQLLLSELDHLLTKRRLSLHPARAVVWHPGNGYLALAAAASVHPQSLEILGRDLTALETTRYNLEQHSVQYFADTELGYIHDIGLDQLEAVELCIARIPGKHDLAIYQQWLRQLDTALATDGMALFASTSTVITRMEDLLKDIPGLTVQDRRRSDHYSVIQLIHS